ncbi:hypothetical protein CRYUN_Cryun09bG0128200 [Craigia yunnanensis]
MVQVHGNVCLASVVVTQTLEWKLHAFDVLSEYDGTNGTATGPMLQYEWLVGSQYKLMELAKSDWATIRKSPPWAIDSWGLVLVTLVSWVYLHHDVPFGLEDISWHGFSYEFCVRVDTGCYSLCLIYEIFSGRKLGKTEELSNIASFPKGVFILIPCKVHFIFICLLSCLTVSASRLSAALELHAFSQVEYIKAYRKQCVEKETFFHKLPNLAEQLPHQIVLKKLLSLLASALEFGSAAGPALTALLKMGSWLSAEEFTLKVLPTIVKLFASNDRAIRVAFLQHIDQYGKSLSAQVVDEQVSPHVATGFADTSAFLRELTLKSMLILACKLSQRTMSGSFLKYLSKSQVDEEPAIRTNTTILLGNIASYLNEGGVLINAFTVRALHDTFSPSRAAGVMALCATSSYYDMTEIATQILPNIVVLIIDPDRWAMNSLTLKGKPSDQAPLAAANSITPSTTTTSTASSGLIETPSTAPVHRVSSITDFADQPMPASPTSTDGWGEIENGIHEEQDNDKDGWDDIEPLEEPKPSLALANIQDAQKRPVSQLMDNDKDGWDDIEPLEEPKPSLALANIQDAQKRPVSQPVSEPKPQATSLRPKSTVKVTKDEDDDLWTSIAAAPPKSASKPLNVKTAVAVDDDDPWTAIAAPPPTTN